MGTRRMKKRIFFLILISTFLLACNIVNLTATPTLDEPMPETIFTATPTLARSVPEIILAEVLQGFDRCRSNSGIEAGDNIYSFSCSNSADTGYTVSMTRFGSEAEARTQFEANRGDNPLLCFQGYDQYEANSTNPYNQYVSQEQLGWQAGQWVVSIYASFDYGYFHYTARGFSEAVYASGVTHGLFLAGTCP
jgi:hypothetical protein